VGRRLFETDLRGVIHRSLKALHRMKAAMFNSGTRPPPKREEFDADQFFFI